MKTGAPLAGHEPPEPPRREPIADWAQLARAEAFPLDPSAAQGVEWIQTHLSHVYRTARRVYKFRKQVDLGFVRFLSRAERNTDCLREVSLNRRLAPDVYLGVAPLVGSRSHPRIGPTASELTIDVREHCVVMRRLPEGRDALSLLETEKLSPQQVDALAALLARFHAANMLGVPAPFTREQWRERCTRPAEQTLQMLDGAEHELAPADLLARARDRMRSFAAQHAERFERRRREGRAVDAHGDLHLQHVWYERDGADPIAIDCLEFSEELRKIDVASEVAFFAMDLTYRCAVGLAERFLRSYARESDDFDLYSVVDYFIAYRAAVRAKVAAIAARDAAIDPAQREAAAESVRRHLALAAAALMPSTRPALVLVGGVVGTGKSTVAAELADRLDGVVIASDRVRKRLAGVTTTTRLDASRHAGAYTPEQTGRVYTALLDRARPVLTSRRAAILDATFAHRAHRAEAARLASELGASVFFAETDCPAEIVQERLARRAEAGTDPSDAGPELYAESVKNFEPATEWPERSRGNVRTDTRDWRGVVADLAKRICAAH